MNASATRESAGFFHAAASLSSTRILMLLLTLLGFGCGVQPIADSRADEAPSEVGGSPPPNVILIVVDTLRADFLSCYGGSQATPNIDALARSGVIFRRAYSHIPITGPSHATLFTGQLPAEHGYHNNPQILAAGKETLAEFLSEGGWQTAAFVSLGVLQKRHGLDQGFGLYDDKFGLDWFKGAAAVNQEVEIWLRGAATEPFFLWVHFAEPHEPYTPVGLDYPQIRIMNQGEEVGTLRADGRTVKLAVKPDQSGVTTLRFEVVDRNADVPLDFRKLRLLGDRCEIESVEGLAVDQRRFGTAKYRGSLPASVKIRCSDPQPAAIKMHLMALEQLDQEEKRRRYGMEVLEVDRQVGVLLDTLDALGLAKRSLVILTADHGESLGEHGFSGHVTQLYEPLLHVPLLIRRPGSPAAGTAVLEPVRHIDLLPTILDAVSLPAAPHARGHSLLPLMQGEPASDNAVVATTYRPEARFDSSALVSGGFKLILAENSEELELYALDGDPAELNDLSAVEPERARAMAKDLWRRLKAAQGVAAATTELSDEDREQLRALGYLE